MSPTPTNPITARATDASAMAHAEEQDEQIHEVEELEEAAEKAEEAVEEKEVNIPIEINSVVDNTLFRTVGKQGRAKNKVTWLFKPALSNGLSAFSNIAKMVGIEHLVKVVYDDVVKPACVEATKSAKDDKTGKYSVSKFAEAFVGYFVSEKRGGSGIRELRKKFDEKTKELMPWFAAQVNPDEAQAWTDEETAHWRVLLTEWAELNEKLGAVKTGGRGKKGKGKGTVEEVKEEIAA